MSVVTHYLPSNVSTETARRLFVCTTEAERPASGLLEGEFAWTRDTKTLWISLNATTWAQALTSNVGASFPVTLTSVDLALDASHLYVVALDVLTVTLPAAADHAGRFYKIKAAVDGVIVAAADEIDGLASGSLSAGDCLAVFSDGTTWRIE